MIYNYHNIINLNNVLPSDILLIKNYFVITKYGLYDITNVGTNQYELNYINVDNHNDILDVSRGLGFTLVLTTTGLYGIGTNKHGQLGLGYTSVREFEYIKISINNVIALASCYFYSIVLLKDGSIYGFGQQDNQTGFWEFDSLSKNGSQNNPTPLKIKVNSKVLNIMASSENMILNTEQGFMGCINNYQHHLGNLGKATWKGFSLCEFFRK
jgi:alpha-tubulin suppressor-like RCC1 family protein